MVAGDLPAADALFTRSAELCRRFRAVPLLARTLADHAVVLERLGRSAPAARAAEEARLLAASVGLVLPASAAPSRA
jgi:hypothetical protein